MRWPFAAFLTLSLLAFAPGGLRAEILIATAGPMKGQYATLGDQLRQGAQLAVSDINAAGGINGETLALAVEDDNCDPKQAVSCSPITCYAQRKACRRPLLLGSISRRRRHLCRCRHPDAEPLLHFTQIH